MTNSDSRLVAALRESLKEAERLRKRNGELLAAASEPIAIIGMSCRYPGGIASPEDLWQALTGSEETDVVSAFPTDRGWDLDHLFDDDPDRHGRTYVRRGGFLDRAADFDAGFFGISPREAIAMDPQHRLLLEVSWEALERARIDPGALRGSRTGVFTGLMTGTYGLSQRVAPGGSGEHEWYLGISSTGSVASGRVSYTLGLEGPAVSLDTACSSSLVALHLAVQSLRRGESTLALAGAAAVMSTPALFVEFSRQRGLAPDGRCKSFSAAADGTNWSEGVGVLALERLSDAERLGHPVLALIRGTAVNQDGASNGLTAPNGPSQQRVIRAALSDAALSPAEVDVVEAHGTGTPLGDPIEAQAVLAAYGQDRPRPLLLGSLKSHLGHTQTAAGAAGVIAMVQAMRHGTLPRTRHLDHPTPHVDWSAGAVELLTEQTPWPETGRPRRAGVSAFGVSGTNAHVVLEQPPQAAEQLAEPAGSVPDSAPVLWPFSGVDDPSLCAQAGRLLDFATGSDTPLADIGWSLATTRATLDRRAVALGRDRAVLCAALSALADGVPGPGAVTGRAIDGGVVFVFPGQGSQWAGMGQELLRSSPVFAESMHRCAAAFSRYVTWDLLDVLGDAEALERGEVVQPALFSVMVSLAALWRSFGVEPAAVVGHSQGEIAAAHVAGVLSLEDAVRIVALRSRLIGGTLAGRGGMVSVPRSAEVTEALIAPWGDALVVAAYNGPAVTAVAGDLAAVEELLSVCAEQGVAARRIPIAYASHSAHIEEVREEMLDLLDGLNPEPPGVAYYSSLTGGLMEQPVLDAGYWYENARRPIDFTGAVGALLDDGHRVFVECSAHPVLAMTLQDILDGAATEGAVLGSLRRGEGGLDRFLNEVATAYVNGVPVDWTAVHGPDREQVDLPTYAFQRRRFWLESVAPALVDATGLGLDRPDHALLGAGFPLPDSGGYLFAARLSLRAFPWLGDHMVHGSAVLPGAALVELAVRAADQVGCRAVEELTVLVPLVLPPTGAVRLHLAVGGPDGSGARTLRVYARDDDDPDSVEWTLHASGTLVPEAAGSQVTLDQWPPTARELDVSGVYPALAGLGIDYGPAFRGLRRAWRAGAETFAEVGLPEEVAATGFVLHPALLDAALHAVFTAAEGEQPETPRLPFVWSGVQVHASRAAVLRVRLTRTGEGALAVDICDAQGAPVASVASVLARPFAAGQLSAGRGAASTMLYRPEWKPLDMPSRPAELLVVDGLDDIPAGAAIPAVVAVRLHPGVPGTAPERARTHSYRVLDLVQRWIAEERFADARLAVVTHRAAGADATDPAQAAVWGLIRSAQAEHPDRFLLVDLERDEDTGLLPAAVATGEPQLLVRDARLHALRLLRAERRRVSEQEVCGPEGTVLITGGSGGLARLLARHLVAAHGVPHLTMLSRRGAAAPGSAQLAEELAADGASVTFVSCDVADRAALAGALRALGRPLHTVVHTAGVVDDGLIESLDRKRIDTVFAPKVDAVVHLDELTRTHALRAFVVFSSVAGVLGGPAQGNYAAANAFLDAFATVRRSAGLPATSLAWGMWEQQDGMAGRLSPTDRSRLSRDGMLPLTDEQGLLLFDAALFREDPAQVPVRLDTRALADRGVSVRPILRELAAVAARPTASSAVAGVPEATGLAERLKGLSAARRDQTLAELVHTEIITVLGHGPDSVLDPARPFKDLGFDSLTAVELRNRLSAVTGLRLPTAMVFDHPNTAELVSFIHAEVLGSVPGPAQALTADIDRIDEALGQVEVTDTERTVVTSRLQALLAKWQLAEGPRSSREAIESASDDEMFALIDSEVGTG
ncbi:type I polyketide synthase [Streptacidiphilus sp. EB103A]|uniref:type I polyketide synthase n=1 Tax=Streptacidiphilus sp. EB103A TaxID=3156275 RepID=UPI0035152C11